MYLAWYLCSSHKLHVFKISCKPICIVFKVPMNFPSKELNSELCPDFSEEHYQKIIEKCRVNHIWMHVRILKGANYIYGWSWFMNSFTECNSSVNNNSPVWTNWLGALSHSLIIICTYLVIFQNPWCKCSFLVSNSRYYLCIIQDEIRLIKTSYLHKNIQNQYVQEVYLEMHK